MAKVRVLSADGGHIQILHIGHIWKHAPQLITEGHVYVPQPPLFRAVKKGQKDRWFYTTAEMNAARDELKGWEISRFKGLEKTEPLLSFPPYQRGLAA